MLKVILKYILRNLSWLTGWFLIAWLGESSWPEDSLGIVISCAIIIILIISPSVYQRKSNRERKEAYKSLGDLDKKQLQAMGFLSGFIFAPSGFAGLIAVSAYYASEIELIKLCTVLTSAIVIINLWLWCFEKHTKAVLDCQRNPVNSQKPPWIIASIALVASWGLLRFLDDVRYVSHF